MAKRQAGFTLIELTITLAVIAILTWFLVPNIWQPIHESKIRGLLAKLKK